MIAIVIVDVSVIVVVVVDVSVVVDVVVDVDVVGDVNGDEAIRRRLTPPTGRMRLFRRYDLHASS